MPKPRASSAYKPPYFLRRQYHEERIGPFNTAVEARAYEDAQVAKDSFWNYEATGLGYWDEWPVNACNVLEKFGPTGWYDNPEVFDAKAKSE